MAPFRESVLEDEYSELVGAIGPDKTAKLLALDDETATPEEVYAIINAPEKENEPGAGVNLKSIITEAPGRFAKGTEEFLGGTAQRVGTTLGGIGAQVAGLGQYKAPYVGSEANPAWKQRQADLALGVDRKVSIPGFLDGSVPQEYVPQGQTSWDKEKDILTNIAELSQNYSRPAIASGFDALMVGTAPAQATLRGVANLAVPGIFEAIHGPELQQAAMGKLEGAVSSISEKYPSVGPLTALPIASLAGLVEYAPQILMAEGATGAIGKFERGATSAIPSGADLEFGGQFPKPKPVVEPATPKSPIANITKESNIDDDIEAVFGAGKNAIQESLTAELGRNVEPPVFKPSEAPPAPITSKVLERAFGMDEVKRLQPQDVPKRYNDLLDIAAIEQNQYSTSPFDPLKSGNTLGSLIEPPDAAALPKGPEIKIDSLSRATEAKAAAEAPVLSESKQKVKFEFKDADGKVITMEAPRDVFERAKATLESEGNGHLIREVPQVEDLKPGEAVPAPPKKAGKLATLVEDLPPDATPEQIAARYPAPELPAIDKPVPRINKQMKVIKGTGESFLDIAKKYMSGENAVIEANRLAEEWKAKNTVDSYDGTTPAIREKGYAGEEARYKARGQALKGGITPIYSYIKRNYTGVNAESLIAAGMKGELRDTNLVKPKGGARWRDIVEAIRQDGFVPKDMMDQEILSALVDEYNLRERMKETPQGRSELANADKALAEVLKEGIEGPYAAGEGPMMYSGIPVDLIGKKLRKLARNSVKPPQIVLEADPGRVAMSDAMAQEMAAINAPLFGASGGLSAILDIAAGHLGLQPPSAVFPLLSQRVIRSYEAMTGMTSGIGQIAQKLSRNLSSRYLKPDEIAAIGDVVVAKKKGEVVRMSLPEYKAWVQGYEQGHKVAGITEHDLVAFGLNGSVDVSKLPANVAQAVNTLKKIFDRLADAEGIPAENRQKNYYPHVFRDPAILDKLKKLDPDNKGWNVGEYGINITDPNLKARIGLQGWSLDWQRALDARVRNAGRKIYMESVFGELDATAQSLREKGDLTSTLRAKMLEDYSNMLKGRPAKIDMAIDNIFIKAANTISRGKAYGWAQALDKTQWAQRMRDKGVPILGDYIENTFLPHMGMAKAGSRAVADAMYFSIMALAIPTGTKNLFQVANTVAYHGLVPTIKGAAHAITPAGRKAFRDSKIMADFANIADGMGGGGSLNRGTKFWKEIAYFPMYASEFINRSLAFNTGLLEALELQKNGDLPPGQDVATRYALATTRKTQFQYGITENSPIMNNAIGRVMRVLGTYPQRQAAFIREIATRPNDYKIAGVNAGVWRYLLFTGAVANGMLMMGMDISDSVGAMEKDEASKMLGRLPLVGKPLAAAAGAMPEGTAIPGLGLVNQVGGHYARMDAPGLKLASTIGDVGESVFARDPVAAESARESAARNIEDLGKKILYGSLLLPQRGATLGARLKDELESGTAKMGQRTYRIDKGEALQKYLGLQPEVQRAMEDKMKSRRERAAKRMERRYERRKEQKEK